MNEQPTFCEFVEALGVELTLAQRVLSKVAFDDIDPVDLPDEEHEMAGRLFGPVETIPPEARSVVVVVCGRASGKTRLGALYNVYRAVSADLSGLAPGEQASALTVAPDVRTARQGLRFALGAVKSVPALARCITSETADSFVIQRPDGAKVAIEVLPATRGGSAVRGRPFPGAQMDECAFFRDESSTINDTDIFAAISPRVLPGGKLLITSTPWLEQGVLYTEFTQNWGNPTRAIAAHAPTSLMREGDEVTRSMVERERERDPENAAREFDAQFMSGGSNAFLDAHAIRQATSDELPLLVMPAEVPHLRVVGAGFDGAYRTDASAGVIVRTDGNLYQVCEVFERVPTKGSPLVPSVVDREFAKLARKHQCVSAAADQHYQESVREHFRAEGLGFDRAPVGSEGKAEMYTLTRELLHAGRVKWSSGHKRLAQQLREVIAKPQVGGGLSISQPRRNGNHGDIASAFVLAIWHAAALYRQGRGESMVKQFYRLNRNFGRSDRIGGRVGR